MPHLYLNTKTDSLFLDVTAGDRSPAAMAEIADGVFLHVDDEGVLVAIEVLDLVKRGGLRVDDLDAEPGDPRPAMFDEIERAVSSAPGSGLDQRPS